MPNLPFRPPPFVHAPPQRPTARRRWHPQGLARRWTRALRGAPWFLISALIHLAILAALAFIATKQPKPEAFTGSFKVGIYKPGHDTPQPPEPEDEEPPPEPEPPLEPEPAPEPEPKPTPQPPTPPEPEPAPAPLPPKTKAAPVLEMPGGPEPARDLFAARSPATRRTALRRWGGTPGSEKAVDAGLDWLRRHQDPGTGRWADGDPQLKLAPGLSAMAVMAFLGKGHTHLDDGPCRDTVARGIACLLAIQTADGRFGEPHLRNGETHNRYLMYHQALATLALAEAYAMTRDPKLADPVRRAVAFIARAQQDGGGWDYGDAPTGRNDSSITGWQLMALKSAHAAGIDVPWQTLFGVMRHLDGKTNPLGEVVYADRSPAAGRRGPGMAAVGLLCYQMLGWPRDAELLTRQADILLRELPDWDRMEANNRAHYLHTMYYWYYGTLAMFNMGGSWWREWNGRLRDGLIGRQRKDGDRRGSWDPPTNGFDSVGGRVYTTALNVLNLEIYYRYLPLYSTPAFDAIDILERAARVRGVGMRRAAVRLLKAFTADRAQAVLASALDDTDRATRIIAKRALVEQRSERAVRALLADLGSPSAFTRSQAVNELAKYRQQRFAPHFVTALRDPDKVVRGRAAAALRKVTGESFGFRADDPPTDRVQAIALWERWWKGSSPPAPSQGIHAAVLVVDTQTPDAVVLDVGRDRGVWPGQRFQVFRDGLPIAVVQADKIQPTLTVARIIERGAEPIREGDAVRSIPDANASTTDARPPEP